MAIWLKYYIDTEKMAQEGKLTESDRLKMQQVFRKIAEYPIIYI